MSIGVHEYKRSDGPSHLLEAAFGSKQNAIFSLCQGDSATWWLRNVHGHEAGTEPLTRNDEELIHI